MKEIIRKDQVKSGSAIIFKDNCQGVLLGNKILICNPKDNTQFKQIPYTFDEYDDRFELNGDRDYNIYAIYTEDNVCIYDREDLLAKDFINSVFLQFKEMCSNKKKCANDNCEKCAIEFAIGKAIDKYNK